MYENNSHTGFSHVFSHICEIVVSIEFTGIPSVFWRFIKKSTAEIGLSRRFIKEITAEIAFPEIY